MHGNSFDEKRVRPARFTIFRDKKFSTTIKRIMNKKTRSETLRDKDKKKLINHPGETRNDSEQVLIGILGAFNSVPTR